MNLTNLEYFIEAETSKSLEEISEILSEKVDFSPKKQSSVLLEKEFYGVIMDDGSFVFRRKPFFPSIGDLFAREPIAPKVILKIRGDKILLHLRNPGLIVQWVLFAIALILFFVIGVSYIIHRQVIVEGEIMGFWSGGLFLLSLSLYMSYMRFKKRVKNIITLLK